MTWNSAKTAALVPVATGLLVGIVLGMVLLVGGMGVVAADGPADVDLDDLDGDGSDGDPYVITNASELQAMEQDVEAHYVLENDIDATETANWNGGDGFDPIGQQTGSEFIGTFDGNGHVIEGLTIDRSESEVGLFGKIGVLNGDSGSVANVSLIDVSISGDGWVGGLVGTHYEGTISDVSVHGTVSGVDEVGGLAGKNHAGGTIERSFASVNVTGNDWVGGLVGHDRSDIIDSYATGPVSGNNDVGGLAGLSTHGIVERSYATGTVKGTGSNVGGLIGQLAGDVQDSFWDTDRSGLSGSDDGLGNTGHTDSELNGLSTQQMQGSASETEMSSLFTSGNWASVSGDYPDLIANQRTISTPHSVEPGDSEMADILADMEFHDGKYNVTSDKALQSIARNSTTLGWDYRLVLNIDASGTDQWDGGDGFEPIGGTFEGTFNGNDHSISELTVERPGLDVAGLFAETSGATITNVILDDVSIRGGGGSNNGVGGLVGTARDTTIKASSSSGSVTGDTYIGGLIGTLRDGSTVSDSTSSVTVSGDFGTGGLVGEIRGSLSVARSHASGDVSGNVRVGGLIGVNTGDVSKSFATGDVTGDEYVGGLVGENLGAITESYAQGDVTANMLVGGLLGLNDMPVSNSYATGTVDGGLSTGGFIGDNMGSLSATYWDHTNSPDLGSADSVGMGSDGGVTALTTAEMIGASAQYTMADLGFNPTYVAVETTYPELTNHRQTTLATASIDTGQSGVDATSPHFGDGIDESTLTISVVDSGGDPVTGLTDSDFDIHLTGDASIAGQIVESAIGEYEVTVTNTEAETVDVTVTADSVEIDQQATIEFLEPPNFDISIVDTDSPVTEGDPLDVVVEVTNTDTVEYTRTISLDIGTDRVYTSEQTIDAGQSKQVTLTWDETAGNVGAHDIAVSSESDVEFSEVQVFGDGFNVTHIDGTEPDRLPHLNIFESGGLLQVQLQDPKETGLDVDELIGLGVDETTTFAIEFETDYASPEILIGAGGDMEWTVDGSGPYDVEIEAAPVSVQYNDSNPDMFDWPAGEADKATIGYDAQVGLAIWNMSTIPEAEQDLLEGAILATDAQVFGFPQYVDPPEDDPELQLFVAAPGITVDDEQNTGFYEAFLPDALLDDWGVTEEEELSAAVMGDSADFTVEDVPGGMRLHMDVTYSAGYISISQSDPPELDVAIEDTNEPVTEGEDLDVTVEIENVGEQTGEQTIELEAFDGTVVDDETISLGPDEKQTITLSWSTEAGDAGTDDIRVSSENHSVTEAVTINTTLSGDVIDAVSGEKLDGVTVEVSGVATTETIDGAFEVSLETDAAYTVSATTSVDGIVITNTTTVVVDGATEQDVKLWPELDGDGTEASPYEISHVYELQGVSQNLDAHYALTDDVDASETKNWNDGDGFDPIGDDGDEFTGIFDGDGYEIADLTIDRSAEYYVGLFGVIDGGTVESVTLADVDVTARGSGQGGLAGENDGTIRDVSITGTITRDGPGASFGGLVGDNRHGTIDNASVRVALENPGNFAGGLTGYNLGGTIVDSNASVDLVDGGQSVGGLAGLNSGDIIRSNASGDIEGTSRVGGLVGNNHYGTIEESFATGDVTGDLSRHSAGGLVGSNGGGEIMDSYATGDVSGNEHVGGLVGDTDGLVTRSFAIGEVDGNDNVGAVAGRNDGGSIIDSYWDTQTTSIGTGVGEGSATGTTGLQTDEMQKFQPGMHMAGLSFGDEWMFTTDYPRLAREDVTALTVDNFDAIDVTMNAGDTDEITITAFQNGGNTGAGVNVTVLDDGGLESIDTGDSEFTDSAGHATFTVAETVAEDYEIEFGWTIDTGVDVSTTVTVDPDDPDVVTIEIHPDDTAAGEIVGGPPTAKVTDQYGNTIPDHTVTVTANESITTGSLTVDTDADGLATFDDLVIEAAGVVELTFAAADISQDSTSEPFTISPASADIIELTPSGKQTIGAGESVAFTATAYDEFDNRVTDKQSEFDWSAADHDGTFSDIRAGSYTVAATYNGMTAEVDVVVEPGDPDSINMTPSSNQTITAGEWVQFDVSVTDKFGNIVEDDNSEFEWEDANPQGNFTVTTAGTHEVTATYESLSNSTTVFVEPASLESVELDPAENQTIAAGENLSFSASGVDAYGNDVNNDSLEFSWTNASTEGVFTNTTVGEYRVNASTGNVSSPPVFVTVEPGPVSDVTMSPAVNETLTAGETIGFDAVAYDEFDNIVTRNNTAFEWINATDDGTFEHTRAGTYEVWASAGNTSSATAIITVESGPIESVELTPKDDQTIAAGESLDFEAAALDEFNNIVIDDPGAFEWTGTDASGVFNETVSDTYDIEASIDGVSADPVAVDVGPGPVDQIVIVPESVAPVEVGETVEFDATAWDEFDNVVADENEALSWSEASSDGVFDATEPGTHDVVAELDGVTTEPVTVTVLEPAYFTIDIETVPDEVSIGESIEVQVEIHNTGEVAGTQTVTLTDEDESELDQITVNLDGDESETISLTFDSAEVAPGTMTVVVSTDDTSVDVSISLTEADEELDDDGLAGFGLIGALIALFSAGWVSRRRRRHRDELGGPRYRPNG